MAYVMETRDNEVGADRIVPIRRGEEPLPSLAGGPLAGRFCAWRGNSGRRYVASVYPTDRSADGLGLPDYDAFVLIAVGRDPAGRRILDVMSIERRSARRPALLRGLAAGAEEWHVHLLVEDHRARAAMVEDLRTRHCAQAAACA